MFEIQKYYDLAHSGEKIDSSEALAYIKGFRQIILWGASYLGAAVGEYLVKNHIPIKNYWDLRAASIKQLNNVEVKLPFSEEDKENTLVVFCIGNNVIRRRLLAKLEKEGYSHVLRGDYLYMGAICPFDKTTGVVSTQCQGSMCCRSIFCQRLSNIIKKRCQKSETTEKKILHMFSVTVIVNQKCSLGCKYCTSYMNTYPLSERKNIDLKQINSDIDRFFSAMDSVGSITVMGGEPFMHPDLDEIMAKLLSYDNFGLISVATSGTYPIQIRQWDLWRDNRINISFSNYLDTIKPNQQKVFYENMQLLKKNNISYTVGVSMPEWAVPSTLFNLNQTSMEMIQKKRKCVQPPRCMQIKDGKLHPCDFGTAVYSLNIADYEDSYVDMNHTNSINELRDKIDAFINQPYYSVCGHCAPPIEKLTLKAAEQGFLDFTKPLQS